ncbi:formyl transferase [Myxozyma melibiosi]|uniref:methionyl-tRNA formyltransferase n=1 Tax=Myxozyma melibiosi TaxID=54550 RepID=A0ABR1FCY5_9ASCO
MFQLFPRTPLCLSVFKPKPQAVTVARRHGQWPRYAIRKVDRIDSYLEDIPDTEENKNGLKIIFFGSDEFSIQSLLRLQEIRRDHPYIIKRLHVATRSWKKTGKRAEVPIVHTANRMLIPVLRAETKDDYAQIISRKYDLAIAVSFGNLIPANFLQGLPLGGVNLHPSLLPRYSGAAPVQWTVFNGDSETGVTLQTLDLHKFDKGEILMQSPIQKVQPDETSQALLKKLGNIGADMLARAITRIAQTESLDRTSTSTEEDYNPASKLIPLFEQDRKAVVKTEFSHAPKILRSHRRIDWEKSKYSDIERQMRAFGPELWTTVQARRKSDRALLSRNIFIDNMRDLTYEVDETKVNGPAIFHGYFVKTDPKYKYFYPGWLIRTCDRRILYTIIRSESYNKKERWESWRLDSIAPVDRLLESSTDIHAAYKEMFKRKKTQAELDEEEANANKAWYLLENLEELEEFDDDKDGWEK